MTSRRIWRIASWLLAPLLVAGAVAAQAGAASAVTTGNGGSPQDPVRLASRVAVGRRPVLPLG